jgi:hypothetical protein
MKATQREAAEAGEHTFYNGRPCKYGHDAYRYTKNGACSECVKGRANLTTEPSPQTMARKAARERMVQVKLVVHDSDLPSLKAAALAFAMMREPAVQGSDVYPNLLATNRTASQALHRFNCFQEDLDALRGVANTLHKAHAVDLSQPRTAAISQAPAGSPPPPWTFK